MFFVPKEQINDDIIEILGDDAYHIARSLRMAVGDRIEIADGDGSIFDCTLTEIRDERCLSQIRSAREASSEPPAKITLFMAYPKGDKLEVVIQKAVELGASVIVPFESERCIKRPSADKLDKRLERLNRIAKEAAKQCGRARLPEVLAPVSFEGMLTAARECELSLFCYEGRDAKSLKATLSKLGGLPKTISVTVGCEGGFSEKEAKAAADRGLVSVNLGPRILRCETAPAYALSALSYHFEL